MSDKQNSFMKMAMDEAKNAAIRGEVPVGAVVVDAGGNVLAVASNRVEELKDATAHAEMLALRAAANKVGDARLKDCDVYVTLEPCAMCAAAISFARVRRLYFAAYDPKGGAVDHGPKFFGQPTCHHAPDVYGGIMEAEGRDILQSFFKSLR
jgi:tRNA(Arg) A34 adenosine deaminase TadA